MKAVIKQHGMIHNMVADDRSYVQAVEYVIIEIGDNRWRLEEGMDGTLLIKALGQEIALTFKSVGQLMLWQGDIT